MHGFIRITNPSTRKVLWLSSRSIESLEDARDLDGAVITLTPSGVTLHVVETVQAVLESIAAATRET